KISKSSMTVEQFMADLNELVEAVSNRLGKGKVAIFGHSWGSVCSMPDATRKRMRRTSAADGLATGPRSSRRQYAVALAEAQSRNNRKAVKDLNAIGPPPSNASSFWSS